MIKIIVDIDNTLWDFFGEFEKRLRVINSEIPPVSEWRWSTPERYVGKKIMHKIIDEIHNEQNNFKPYNDARQFLELLKNLQLHIIIASHRKEEAMWITMGWLHKHKLFFNELHISRDKTILFNEVNIIVDDCPHTLEKAMGAGLIYTGLRFPWNKHISPTFNTLLEIGEYLEDKINGKKKKNTSSKRMYNK